MSEHTYLKSWFDPVALMRVQSETMWMGVEAGAVVWMRSLGMMGLWNVSPSENLRMVTEKQSAVLQSGQAVMKSAWKGETPSEAMAASIVPFRKRTRSNARRLSRRGPQK